MQRRTMLSTTAPWISKQKPFLFSLALGVLPLWGIGSFAGASPARNQLLAATDNRTAEPRVRYSIEEIGPLAGDAASSAVALNDRGQVLGTSSGATERAFLWERKQVHEIGPALPEYPRLIPKALNNRGQVVGSVWKKDSRYRRAFIWETKQPVLRDLGTPPGEISEATGINDKGQVIGSSYAGELRPGKGFFVTRSPGFVWSKAKGFQGLPASFSFSDPLRGINDSGQITGASHELGWAAYRQETAALSQDQIPDMDGAIPSRAFIYDMNAQQGRPQLLPIPQAWDSEGLAINNQGDVVIRARLYARRREPTLSRPYLYLWRKGIITPLGATESWRTLPAALNDAGDVVGNFVVDQADKTARRAVLYRGGKPYPLNELIPANSGWVITEAAGINNKGQIAGTGTHNGVTRAYLLNPVR